MVTMKLKLDEDTPLDIKLNKTGDGLWIECGTLQVHVTRTDEGVVADIWAKHDLFDFPLTSARAEFNDATVENAK